MKWFRLHLEILDDYKVSSLSDHEFRTWIKLLCIAANTMGKLPSVEEIAFRLRFTTARTQSVLSRLIELRLIDEVAGGLIPHNWDVWQYKSDCSTERVRSHRETFQKRSRNGHCNVSETPSDTDTDTEPPISPPSGGVSQTRSAPLSAPLSAPRLPIAKWFAEFWETYPRRVGRKAAEKKYAALATCEEVHTAIMHGLRQQLPAMRAKEIEFVPHPATWLNQGRWMDETVKPKLDLIPVATDDLIRRVTGRSQ